MRTSIIFHLHFARTSPPFHPTLQVLYQLVADYRIRFRGSTLRGHISRSQPGTANEIVNKVEFKKKNTHLINRIKDAE